MGDEAGDANLPPGFERRRGRLTMTGACGRSAQSGEARNACPPELQPTGTARNQDTVVKRSG
ncbi:MAG: hypothetical protein JO037_13755 [Actinobacteria bacterium]|nr:hypothetical protein [Actinomycetota bacterium]